MNADSSIQLAYALQRDDFCLDVKLDLPLRGITGVFGQSGAGKTTLLRILFGKESTDTGEFTFRNGIKTGFLEQVPVLDNSLRLQGIVFFLTYHLPTLSR